MTSRQDVARLAGVSPRTVSNVVSGSATVTEATRQRVLAAIERLDYRPSEIGRMLRSGHTGMLAVVLPTIDSPYFAELARYLTDAARRHGYTLLIEHSNGEKERERELLARADTKAIFDGLIVSPLALEDDDLLRTTRTERPVVLLGEEQHPGFDRVAVDNLAAARDATAHLIASGRRKIVAVGAERNRHLTSMLRLAGFEEASSAAGASVSTSVEYVDDFSRASGAAAAERILAGAGGLPDALFCFSSVVAIGAMSVLRRAGIDVPAQIAVMGFDDVDEGRYTVPSLTTVSPDRAALAEAAVDTLVSRIDGDDSPSIDVVIPHRIVRRESA